MAWYNTLLPLKGTLSGRKITVTSYIDCTLIKAMIINKQTKKSYYHHAYGIEVHLSLHRSLDYPYSLCSIKPSLKNVVFM